MASQPPVHTIDRTPEYEEFIGKLAEFHRQRGTPFEPSPKLGNNHVDLLKLFNYIVQHGGYDAVSDEKLAWRRMCEELGLMTTNPPAAAFSLKTIFYKYLAAYEIKTIHNKEPPPPEILEHTTAKGGGLLTRTLENFAPNRRDGSVAHKDSDGDDGTPVRERASEDTPGSARASRGLRQDPPQRVIFQPDTGPARATRNASGQHATPGGSHASAHQTPSHAGSHHLSQPHSSHLSAYQRTGDGPSHQYIPKEAEYQHSSILPYKPTPSHTLPFRVVETPANRPEVFAEARRVARLQMAGRPPANPARHLTGMEGGPNIYMRCREALLSGIPSEQAYALNHLVKISYERGDRYRFEQFPKLLEGLVEKALEVGQLFYDINWTIIYAEPEEAASGPIGELNGFTGTPDILDRIGQLKSKPVIDGVVSAEFSDQLNLITEAVLTIRNMVIHPDNATYASNYPMVLDLLCVLLRLPVLDMTVELKHFALDIAEQVTPHLILGAGDPLYESLLSQLEKNSDDRGIALTALRAIGRISMELAETNKLDNVPVGVLQKVKDWLLLNDDELMDACLDFLYQYTAVVRNMENLVQATHLEDLVTHLVRLLSHGAKREPREFTKVPEQRIAGNTTIADIPPDLCEQLLAIEEPERCYKWVRCFFEEDPEGQVTQIAIWQAYNKAFQERLRSAGRPMMQAAEFIRSITHVYQNAVAKIKREQGPNGAVVDKYAIDGIRPRKFPMSPEGVEYFPCLWSIQTQPRTVKCLTWLASPEKMWDHILTQHLGVTPDAEDKMFKRVTGEYTCTWAACQKYPVPTKMDLFVFAAHIKLHMIQAYGTYHNQPKKPSRQAIPAKTISFSGETTAIAPRDPNNPNAPVTAGGIPLSATLVLRNIARNVVKTDANEELVKAEGETNGWNERLFRALRPRLYEVMADNRLLAPHIASLLQTIDDA